MTIASGYDRRNPVGHGHRNVDHDPGNTGYVGPEYSHTNRSSRSARFEILLDGVMIAVCSKNGTNATKAADHIQTFTSGCKVDLGSRPPLRSLLTVRLNHCSISSMYVKTVGTTNKLRMVDVINPPMTATDIGLRKL